jgi:LCP family protein required for cell wall assembly
MKNKRPSIDGFIPRRIGGELGELHNDVQPSLGTKAIGRSLHTGDEAQEAVGKARPGQSIGRSDIDESLREIDSDTSPPKRLGRRQRRRLRRQSKPQSRLKRIIRWFFIVVLIIILGIGGYLGIKLLLAGGGIFKGSIFDVVQSQPLKQDSNGRSNFLILGTSEDDPGHGGAYLTDSMMIVSVDQNQKNIYMFSVPRDLYVDYGMACNSGYAGKINEYFSCVNDDFGSDAAEQQRLIETQSFVGEIFGLDIQYGIHVNNTVIKDAVNAVDGVDVDIQGTGEYGMQYGILDRNFDWRCNFTCNLVKYDNGVHHLDGEHALFLAMARGDIEPTYGLVNSNFDREKNQQKIIIALKDKAVSTGVITNLSAVTGLIDALGKNLRTNIQTKEVQTLIKLGSEIKTENIYSISLFDGDNRVVTTGGYNGASVVMPAAGIFDYTDIRAYIAQNLSSDPVVRENSAIIVLNGSGIPGAGQSEADKLEAQGLIIGDVDNAQAGSYEPVELYVVDTAKTATLDKIKAQYSDLVIKTTNPPIEVNDPSVGFVLVIGPPAQ